MPVSFLSLLSAVAPFITLFLSLGFTVAGKVLWNHEKRLREQERSDARQSRTLYGDEQDERQTGLAQDIQQIDERVEVIEDTLSEIESHLSDINGYEKED